MEPVESEHPEKRKYFSAELSDEPGSGPGEGGPAESKRRALESKFTTLSSSITISMDCPNEKVGVVIGKKGIHINEIMKRTNCKIVIDQNFNPAKVYLTGLPDDLALAMSAVTQVVQEGPGVLGLGDDSTISPQAKRRPSIEHDPTVEDHEIVCPLDRVGLVIGAKGQVVNEIMKRTGCKVRVNQDPTPGANPDEREVILTGTVEQIQEAKSLVLTVIADGPTGLLDPSSSQAPSTVTTTVIPTTVLFGSSSVTTLEEDVPRDRVGLVIGSKGSIITEISRRSGGCKVIINQDYPQDQPSKVRYTGSREQIELARVLVAVVAAKGGQALNDPVGTNVVHELSVLQSQTGKLLGAQGSIVKDLQARYNVRMVINFSGDNKSSPPDTLNVLKISGTVENVLLAIRAASAAANAGPNLAGQASLSQSTLTPSPFITPSGSPAHTQARLSLGLQSSQSVPYTVQSSAYPLSSPASSVVMGPPVSAGSSGPQGLGPDGTQGTLEPVVVRSDGLHQQVAEILNEFVGKVIGKQGANLTLIKQKSGAILHVLKSPGGGIDRTPTGKAKIAVVGARSSVQLAVQIIQELLINGAGKILQLPDAAPTASSNATYEATNALLPPAAGLQMSPYGPAVQSGYPGSSPSAAYLPYGSSSPTQQATSPSAGYLSQYGVSPSEQARALAPQAMYQSYQSPYGR